MKLATLLALTIGLTTHGVPALALTETDADKLVRQSKCLSCHRVNRTKDGPSFKETATKYKTEANAEAELTRWVTEKRKVEVDGSKEDHGILKSTNPAEVQNVVQWILTR